MWRLPVLDRAKAFAGSLNTGLNFVKLEISTRPIQIQARVQPEICILASGLFMAVQHLARMVQAEIPRLQMITMLFSQRSESAREQERALANQPSSLTHRAPCACRFHEPRASGVAGCISTVWH